MRKRRTARKGVMSSVAVYDGDRVRRRVLAAKGDTTVAQVVQRLLRTAEEPLVLRAGDEIMGPSRGTEGG
jgi:hypothetical protein